MKVMTMFAILLRQLGSIPVLRVLGPYIEGVGRYYFWTLRLYFNFWYSSWLISMSCAWYWDHLLTNSCSSIICMYIRAVSNYSLWYLVAEINFFFSFESAAPWGFYTDGMLHLAARCHWSQSISSLFISVWHGLILNIQSYLTLSRQRLFIFVLHTSLFHCICHILN